MSIRSIELSQKLIFETVKYENEKILVLLQDPATSGIQLNLHKVTACDSAGLALLINTTKLCKFSNKALEIQQAPERVTALAKFCGVEAILGGVC